MSLREHVADLGPGLVAFCVYQVLALAANAGLAALMLFVTGISGLAGLQDADAAAAALDTLFEAVVASANAGAIAYGLRLVILRSRATRQFWVIYLSVTVLLYGFFSLRGDSACFSTFPMVVNIGWLAFWVLSRRVQQLYP